MNTSTWVSSMIPPLVFTEWTSTSYSQDQARESPEERSKAALSVNSRKSAKKTPSNGSSKSSVALSSEQLAN
jgi:hypothetical protein